MTISYLPPPGNDAAMSISGETAEFLEKTCAAIGPHKIVDLGTGNGGSLCALARRAPSGCVIWTVDDDAQFLQKGLDRLAHLDHEAIVHSVIAPIRTHGVNPELWWYDPKPLAAIPGPIDILFVDGPSGKYDRSPALPHFLGRLAQGAHVYLDDYNRSRERQIFRKWKELLKNRGAVFTVREVSAGRSLGELHITKMG